MSDALLRELERRWRASRSHEDHAAYLLELVRAGAVPRERLELASYLGHLGAMHALRDKKLFIPVEEWMEGIALWGRVPAVRAALVLARSALPVWERHAGHGGPLAAGIAAIEQWLACPCAEHARKAESGLGPILSAQDPGATPAWIAADRFDAQGHERAVSGDPQQALRVTACALECVVLEDPGTCAAGAMRAALELANVDWLKREVLHGLMPWVLAAQA